MNLFESSFGDLYRSAVEAFPRTGLRQHATNTVVIERLSWVPFRGTKTLFVKGTAKNEGRIYYPMILFKAVNYLKEEVSIIASDGLPYQFGKLSLDNTEVVLRCDCLDYRYRFGYYNKLDKSLYGSTPKKYIRVEGSTRPPVNPKELPGACKHLMKLAKVLEVAQLIS